MRFSRVLRWGAIGLVVLVVVGAIAGCSDEPQGNPTVYARIESMTDCVKLQREFDIAADNTDRIQDAGRDAGVSMSYMDAADNRLKEVGCYG